MATRGTYEIGNMRFYCHWDNGPEGAALKLAQMIRAYVRPVEDARCFAFGGGGLAYAFVRGVDRAEPYEGGDTGGAVYHYSIRPTGAGHSATIYTRDKEWRWQAADVLPLQVFINRYQDEIRVVKIEGLETIPPFLATAENARTIGAALAEEARGFPECNPNRESKERAARVWLSAAQEARP